MPTDTKALIAEWKKATKSSESLDLLYAGDALASALESAEAEFSRLRPVPTAERMPEKEDTYLVRLNIDGRICWSAFAFKDGAFPRCDEPNQIVEVTHWCAVPKLEGGK